ncbi:diguanylate cyclase/phosphodiesterase (GGDEF & EAL domains) with PAS/PAC sensor(s) [hydrothermal vent metagenome]|uniref:Diguanylate cyclase/phosphodiesterase (GGDEF & EAL domains) with PAS/PAC sensor(S) n=1 Tax=hydrothermal vent metagenome TaxID=652676 RepID=A0A3B0Z241_9ZZZZ
MKIASLGRAEQVLILLGVVFLSLILVYSQSLQKWDNVIYDTHLKYDSAPAPDDIVIVAIDEQSLAKFGRWPWPRQLHAELIDILHDAGSKTVALNIIFSEPTPLNNQSDVVLAEALQRHGRVILPVLPEQEQFNAQLKESLPLPILAAAAAGLGHVDMELDQDGINRRVFFKAGLGTAQWSQLALAMLELEDANIMQSINSLKKTSTANFFDAWVRDYTVLLPYVGPPGHFQRISYADIFLGNIPAEAFRNKYVLVGATAAGLGDTLPTPVSGFGQAMPGVEVQANILDALRRNAFVQPLDIPWQMLLTGMLMLSTLFWASRLSSRGSLLITISLLIFPLVLSIVLLRSLHVWFPPSAALLGLGLSYLLWSWYHLINATRLLSEQKERAEVTLYSISDAVIATDERGFVEHINPIAESLTGWTKKQAQGQPVNNLFRVIDEQSREEIIYPVAHCLQAGQSTVYPDHSAVLSHNNHKERAIRASASPIISPKGKKVSGAVIVFSDVTEARCMAQQMEYQATHDALTNLPNRALLHMQLQKAIARTIRTGQQFALLFVDLDRFKAVNDGLGHTSGDTLLKAVGLRLKASSRKSDTVARFGGDEFVIILENIHHEKQAASIARKIHKTLETPYTIEGRECFISASIGISLFPGDGQDAETLLKNADAAMYQAKEKGRNNIQYYSQEMNVHSKERLLLEEELRHAVERQQLVLHYQPQMEFKTGKVLGVEVLLRWQHPRLGLVAPAEFISLAEETGLIVSIGQWVMQTAAAQSKSWQENGLPQLKMAINLSPRQFMEQGITDMIVDILEQNRLDPRYLELEITENLIMRDMDSTIDTLQSLKSMGVQLAIDDFGTGYSSLSYLKRFPIDCLKIDQSFVRDIDTNPDDAAITLAIIAMAHSMKLKVIAEGVETKAQFNYLKSHSCDEVQGYYFSRPLPANEIVTILKAS